MWLLIHMCFMRRRACGPTAGDGSGGVCGGEWRGRGGLPLRLAFGAASPAVGGALGACARAQVMAAQEDATRSVLPAKII